MARRVFFSFYYKADNWRASQIRQIGTLEGNSPVSDNDWESITRGGDKAISAWIDGQISGKSCTIVLIGANTAGRKWIEYEIGKSWDEHKGLLGVYIHNLLHNDGKQSAKGRNPFTITRDNRLLLNIVKSYDPPFSTSKNVYDHIKENLEKWVEEAISIRNNY